MGSIIINPEEIQNEIKSTTKLIATTHASNVIGTTVDIKKIGQIAAENNVKYLVDASQTIGVIEIDVNEIHVDLLAMSGHKNLFGPAGTGALYIREGINLTPLRHGGTGTASESLTQPEIMPHKYESGTANLIGIAGLNAGIKFIFSEGMEKIRRHEEKLSAYMYKELLSIHGVTIYGTDKACDNTSVISLNIKDEKASVVGQKLLEEFNIVTRAGLHCAPLAHKTIGTESRGTVRFGIGYFNTKEDIDASLEALDKLCKSL